MLRWFSILALFLVPGCVMGPPSPIATILAPVRAYDPGVCCCGPNAKGITATGRDAYTRGAATAWAALPRGTVLRIAGYGIVRVDDTGGDLRKAWEERGEVGVEVRFATHSEARAWGCKDMEVEILEG
jgi:3D (Asp-Asp-Asp) domain-containing protein